MNLFWALGFTLLFSFSVTRGGTDIDESQTYIVKVDNELKPSEFSDVGEWYSSTLRTLTSNNPTTSTRRDFLYMYKNVFHGFAARLTKEQAQILKGRPEILKVFPDRVRQLHTTRSPQFLGLTTASIPNSLLNLSDSGSNIVIGVFDTGIWPERSSFSDEGLGPIPSHWKGECMEGERFSKTLCNKKLIGARYFIPQPFDHSVDIESARDSIGHGTHTASTAAGNHVANASFLGYAKGDATGIAPKARIAVYKICWSSGCLDSVALAAFDKAVEDGVDIISYSIGIEGISFPLTEDVYALGAFGAMERGIFVVASAGNSGPAEATVTNVAPWITTVGAGSLDRNFPADLVLGNGRVITGASLYKGKLLPENKHLPLVDGGSCSLENLYNKRILGNIVVCGDGDSVNYFNHEMLVKKNGGAGVVVYGTTTPPYRDGLTARAHLFPGLSITQSAIYILRAYLISTVNPTATIVFRGTQIAVKPAPVVAQFSSRGPNLQSIYVLKPDLIAPGLNILAAWPDDVPPTNFPNDERRVEFNIKSGTSMSCPHVAGLAALLKGAHPDWSPAMIRSALVTTAYTQYRDGKPLLKRFNFATAWDMGAGHVDPIKAVDPGLVYDLTVDDYLNFLCASNYNFRTIQLMTRRSVNCRARKVPPKPWNLNYPSISVAFDPSGSSKLEYAVRRTVTHVSEGASKYTVMISNPVGVMVKVYPTMMQFKKKGQKQSYMVRISVDNFTVPRGTSLGESGKLTWTDGKHQVTSPIAVAWHKLW